MIRGLLREARPLQWAKNILVFAAPGALGVLFETGPLVKTLTVFVAFCLVSSGTYFWNDIKDVEQDRLHPVKKNRPIAAGVVSLQLARIVGSSLLVLGPCVAAVIRPQAGAVLLLYAVLTFSYSSSLKHVPLLDLTVVASGFVLRATAGAVASSISMSSWFILCITFGSFFIVTGKRFAELKGLGVEAMLTRPSLSSYTEAFLSQLLMISCTATLVTYCLWALENSASSAEPFPLHAISIVPMALALFRYLMVLHDGGGGAPEEVFSSDRSLQFYGLSWIMLYGVAVYAS